MLNFSLIIIRLSTFKANLAARINLLAKRVADDSTNKMIAFIKSGENYQFAAGGHPVATPGNHPVVGQFGISPFHQQQTQVQFQTHRIGIDPQGNLYES